MIHTKLRKGTVVHIEQELFAYPDTKREMERLREEILYARNERMSNIGGGRTNIPSDPTARMAIQLTSHTLLQELTRMTEAIEHVMERLPDEKQQLVKLVYWTKPKTLTWEGIAMKLNVSRRTAINWRDEVVYAIAHQLGWQ